MVKWLVVCALTDAADELERTGNSTSSSTRPAPPANSRVLRSPSMVAPRLEVYTYADLERLPDNVVGELIDGMLYASPRPADPHVMASSVLGFELGPPFQFRRGGPGGWIILDEPEVHLGGDVLVPDFGGWRIERAPPRGVTFYETAPDWVCEVLSPSTQRLDRAVKLRVYARERVPWVWLIDPVAQTLEVYQLDGETYRLAQTAGGDETIRARPFEAIELDLVLLWTGRPRET